MKQVKIFESSCFKTEEDFVEVVNTFCSCENVLEITRTMVVKDCKYYSSVMVIYEK